jgi:hypothetical protein
MDASSSTDDLLVLRLSMSKRREAAVETRLAPTAPADQASAATAEMKGLVGALDPTARKVNLELRQGEKVYGRWTFTAGDLNVPFDPEALVLLQERFSGVRPLLNGLAARGAQALSDTFPTIVTVNRLDSLRQALSSDHPSLPLVISKALHQALDEVDAKRRVVWLELVEPLGFLPLLPWERVLSAAVGVPILRIARKALHGFARKGTLDVLLVCCTTSTDKRTITPKAVVALCRHILATLPDPKRCVVHLFADVLHREAVESELAASGLPVVHDGEPAQGRGVVLYPYPGDDARTAIALEKEGRAQTIWERPWAAWIKGCMAGRAVDVVHVVSEAGFCGLQPALEITAVPWDAPLQVGRTWAWRPVSRVQLRYVDAPLACDFATGLGAWGIVFSAPNAESLRAQRALMHQTSGLLPGMFAVHDLSQDAGVRSCSDLYRFLVGPGGGAESEPFIPDHAALSLQCHPAMLKPQAAEARIKASLGDDFAQAVQQLKAEMDRQGSTPAWAAVLQRHIELSVSANLSSDPLTERDKAAREGVTTALTVALSALAKHMKSDR